MHGRFKKDYEPYQTMGPLCGIFDQRADEQLNHHADRLGFDAISAGGTLAWLMDCIDDDLITPGDLGVDKVPRWEMTNFDVVKDSMHNAELGMALLDQMIQPGGSIALQFGARKLARRLAREKGRQVLDRFVYNAFARSINMTASRITSRNASVFWESERNTDMVSKFLKNTKEIDGVSHPEP